MSENEASLPQSQTSAAEDPQSQVALITQPEMPAGSTNARKRTQTTGPQIDSKSSAKKQKKNASDVKKEEEDRVKQIAAKIEAYISKANVRARIKLNDCRRADFQRDLDNNHIEELMTAHIQGKFKLHRELIIVMPDLNHQSKYVIIDGQHRWTALKKLASRQNGSGSQRNSGTPTSNERSELTSIDAVVLPREFSMEEQQIAANLGDRSNRPQLPFSNVDLVKEVQQLCKSNPFLTGLKFTRNNQSTHLSIARIYNPRIQEFHIIIACNYSDEDRIPLLDLMKAIDAGKFLKSGKGSIKNNSTLWRRIFPLYKPALAHNVKIVRSFLLEFAPKFENLISIWESEGSQIRPWLDEHDRKQVKVQDFIELLGLEQVGSKGPSLGTVYSFLSSICTGSETDEELVKKARKRFSDHIPQNVHKLQFFLNTPPSLNIDFIYVDLRLMTDSHDNIVNWASGSKPTYRLIRDFNPVPKRAENSSSLKSFYAGTHLSTLTLADFNFPSDHSLRESFLHLISDYSKDNFVSGHHLMVLDELFEGLLKDLVGVCFLAHFDVKNYSSIVKNGLHSFVIDKSNVANALDDGTPHEDE